MTTAKTLGGHTTKCYGIVYKGYYVVCRKTILIPKSAYNHLRFNFDTKGDGTIKAILFKWLMALSTYAKPADRGYFSMPKEVWEKLGNLRIRKPKATNRTDAAIADDILVEAVEGHKPEASIPIHNGRYRE